MIDHFVGTWYIIYFVFFSQFDQELEELKAQHLKELTDRDGKMKVLKMHMADALKDNSR